MLLSSRYYSHYAIALLCAFIPATTLARETPPTPEIKPPPPSLERELSREIVNNHEDQFFTLSLENDMFGRGTDQNYTNGIRFSYLNVNAEFPEFAHKIAEAVPTFSINPTSSIFYSAGHNMFTPDDIGSRVQDPDDRPWAAFLYGSVGMATLTDNHIDELEATVGVVGPLALGEQIQKAVHRHISDSEMPKGWSNQLKNEPGIILSWQRRWPQALRHDFAGFTMTAEPYAGTSLGNIYTYANTGLNIRLSPARGEWNDTPVRVRPAIPGTGYFEPPEEGWNWYLFAGLEGRAVARNIFLDGNSFTDSHSVDKYPLVGDANAGLALTFGHTRLSYTLVHRSKEFEGQDRADLFGAFSVSYRF